MPFQATVCWMAISTAGKGITAFRVKQGSRSIPESQLRTNVSWDHSWYWVLYQPESFQQNRHLDIPQRGDWIRGIVLKNIGRAERAELGWQDNLELGNIRNLLWAQISEKKGRRWCYQSPKHRSWILAGVAHGVLKSLRGLGLVRRIPLGEESMEKGLPSQYWD